MEIILKQDVDKVGKAGSTVKVSDGYARNYLLPRGLAVPSTPAMLKQIEQERQRKNLESEKRRRDAEEFKTRMAGVSLTIPAQVTEEEKLFGSVTAQDISAALTEEGFAIDKSAVMLDEPIKSLGIVEVPVRLHPDVTAQVKVWIVKK